MRIHSMIKYIQEWVEEDMRVWGYLLPSKNEEDGHDIQGILPVWQPVKKTDHFICEEGKTVSFNKKY